MLSIRRTLCALALSLAAAQLPGGPAALENPAVAVVPSAAPAPSAVQAPERTLVHLPKELTDATFDHDTQLGTHDTTGPWFIKFYAPWCGHCRRMEGVWNEFADAVHGRLNVASVDATANKKLAERFRITGYPTLLLFQDHKLYRYTGQRTIADLTAFALEGGYQEKPGEPVPKPLTQLDRLRKAFVSFVYDFEAVVTEKPNAAAAVAFSGFSVGIATGALITGLWMERRFRARSKKVD